MLSSRSSQKLCAFDHRIFVLVPSNILCLLSIKPCESAFCEFRTCGLLIGDNLHLDISKIGILYQVSAVNCRSEQSLDQLKRVGWCQYHTPAIQCHNAGLQEQGQLCRLFLWSKSNGRCRSGSWAELPSTDNPSALAGTVSLSPVCFGQFY